MCKLNNCEALRNGHAADPTTQGHALADIIESLATVESHVKELPTRKEVLDIVETSLSVHTKTCAMGRKLSTGKKEASKFRLGKWVEAEGPGGTLLGALLVLFGTILGYFVIPYVNGWISAWASK